jgi:hypothetical protein
MLYFKGVKRFYAGKRTLAYTWATLSSDDTGEDRTVSSINEKYNKSESLLSTLGLRKIN